MILGNEKLEEVEFNTSTNSSTTGSDIPTLLVLPTSNYYVRNSRVLFLRLSGESKVLMIWPVRLRMVILYISCLVKFGPLHEHPTHCNRKFSFL